ncbi:MAG: winged helix-turn-helix domain-containing protein [Candidatus Aureabacteria bacterium]|nr:winged helix-turn-helix domain-containing protein [Candidatus Auribacterota bacterium]
MNTTTGARYSGIPLSAAIRHNPFWNAPIDCSSLNLFTGRENELDLMRSGLERSRRILLIEGAPGVGKRSLGNYFRFERAIRGLCLSPEPELDFPAECAQSHFWALAARVALNKIIKETHAPGAQALKAFMRPHDSLIKKWARAHMKELRECLDIDRLRYYSHRKPIPASPELVECLDYLAQFAVSMGFTEGLIFQLRVGEGRATPPELIQSLCRPHITWIVTGLSGSGRAAAETSESVTWIDLSPLSMHCMTYLVKKRLGESPSLLSEDILKYLYNATEANLGYIMEVCAQLFDRISYQQGLVTSLNLKYTKPLILSIAHNKIAAASPSRLSESILRHLSRTRLLTTGRLSRALRKKQASVSRILSKLKEKGLVTCHSVGREHLYRACPAARIIYGRKDRLPV